MHRRIVQEIISSRVFQVTLTGGEPLGVLEQVYPGLLALKQAGVFISINTNLAILDRPTVLLLQQLGIRSVLTSLMSADQGVNDEIAQQEGAYRRTVAGIRFAVENGFRVSVNMVVSQKNFHTIYETGELACALGAKAFCATKASKPSNCPDFSEHLLPVPLLGQMFLELLRIKETLGIEVDSLEHYPACSFPDDKTRTAFGNRNCSAAKASCTIGFEGSVRPCSHAPIPYGNVVQVGLFKAWQSMDEWRTGELVPTLCKQCCGEFPARCGGGCRVESLNANGAINGVDPYSLSHKPNSKQVFPKVTALPPDTRVVLDPKVLFRPEEFGYIAYRSSSKWLAIDGVLYAILKESLKDGGVKAATIVEACQCTETDALKTFSMLRKKGIVKIV